MNKTVRGILIGFVATVMIAALLLGTYYWNSYKSNDNVVADIVNKGNAYMEAACYEDAINCYEKALEHEQGNEQLISAIVSAYMLWGDSLDNNQEAAICYLNAIAYNPNNKTAYWDIANIYESEGNEDAMMEVLRQGYDSIGDETMHDKVAGIEAERARVAAEIEAQEEAKQAEEAERIAKLEEAARKLEPLIMYFSSQDYDTLKDMMRQEDYIAFSEEVNGDNSFYCGEYDSDGKRTGKGLALYPNGYYYYGDFSEDIRSGQGILMRANYSESSSIGSFIFDGQWKDDAPNGIGIATSNYYKDRISATDFTTKEITGNYTNGLEDGEMTLKGTTKGGATRSFTYKTSAGVAEKSSDEDSGVAGQYIIAKASDGSVNLTSDGSVRGVEGFTDGESVESAEIAEESEEIIIE